MKSRFVICAENVIRDAESGALSIINMLDTIASEGFPLMIQRFYVAFQLDRDDHDPASADIDVSITVGGTLILSQRLAVNFDGKRKSNAILHIGGLPVPHEGVLSCAVAWNNEVLGSYDIHIAGTRPPLRVV